MVLTPTPPDRYRCAWCNQDSVVPELARDCERRHEALNTPDEENDRE